MNDAVAGPEYPNRPAKTATAVGVVRLRHNGDYEDNARLLGRIVCAGQTLPGGGHDVAAVVAADYLATYSGHTRAAYRRDLDCFFAYCQHVAVDPLTATRADLTRYLQHLRDTGRSPSTVARRLVTLRGLYDFAVDEYRLPGSPAARIRIRRPRSQARIHALTLVELRAFLTSADHAGPRTTALAWLLATTGIRISEACSARINDISDTTTEPWLVVTCKNSLRRSVPLHPGTWTRLQPLLTAATGPLFATRSGRPLDRQAAARELTAVATAARISSRFSPHVLRHTFVTLARHTGCALEDVQDAAGHANPATTRAYDRTLQQHADHPAHRILLALRHPDTGHTPQPGPQVLTATEAAS